jgi:sirohydrochlorin ferrochelatase
MKTGAEIVAEIENVLREEGTRYTDYFIVGKAHWPTIRAALLAYEPKSALRTIIDRCARDVIVRPFFTDDELAAAREELTELEKR